MLGDELVREVKVHAPFCPDRSGENDEQVETAGDLPAPQIARGRGAPAVRREAVPARAIARAASTIRPAGTPVSCSASPA